MLRQCSNEGCSAAQCVCVCVCVCVSLCVCVCHCVSEWTEKVPGQYMDGTLKASQMVERGRLREIGHSVVMCVCVCVCVRVA